MPDPLPSLVCLLGMHRSGTSCLSGSLQRAGLFLGKYHTWNHHNHGGNRENPDVVSLNEDILKANGGDWDRPPAWVDWREEHRWRALEILGMYADAPLWGFKDPRTLLTLRGWRQLVPGMRFVGIFRHPLAVVESLHSRGGFPRHIGLFLWEYYNRLLLEQWQQQPFPLLSFDWDEDTFHQRLEPVQAWLGLGPLAVEDRFFTPKLRNRDRFRERHLPPPVRRLYETLQTLANTPWQPASTAA